MASPLAALSRLWTPPADRRMAAMLAAEGATTIEPAAAGMPPRVALVSGNGDGAASRRRIFVDEQRQGVRVPWQPTSLHWRFEDMEPVWQSAEVGNLLPLALVVEAMRSEGITAGYMGARSAFVKKPLTFQGDPWLCGLLRGEPPRIERGRLISPGRRGLFRRMHPTPVLRDMVYTGILANVALAEYVDDPATGLPVLQTRDLHRLRYDWGERAWKYRGQKDEYLVEPGNGRWVLFMPGSTHRPWRSGSWLPLMLAFVVMISTTYDAGRFQAKSADPLKYLDVPDSAPPDEVDRYEEFVQYWWERSPGIVLRYGTKAGIVETHGEGYQIYGAQRAWAKEQISFTLRGSVGTSGEGEGIFADGDNAYEVAEELIADTAEALAECLTVQGIGPWAVRYGYVRSADEAPTCSWDTRSPARKLAEAKAVGEVCDVVAKLDALRKSRGLSPVDLDAYLAQCGHTVPWTIATELQGPDGAALWSGEAEIWSESAPAGLLPEPSTADPVVDQTTPAGSLE